MPTRLLMILICCLALSACGQEATEPASEALAGSRRINNEFDDPLSELVGG